MQEEPRWAELSSSDTNFTKRLEPDENYGAYKFGLSVQFSMRMPMPTSNKVRRVRSPETITLSTGIEWSPCSHENKGELHPCEGPFPYADKRCQR